MRGVALLTAFALALSLAGGVHAADAAPTAADTTQLDDDELHDSIPFELLILPESLRSQARSTMESTLPGPNEALEPNLALLDAPTSVLDPSLLPGAPTLPNVHPDDAASSQHPTLQEAPRTTATFPQAASLSHDTDPTSADGSSDADPVTTQATTSEAASAASAAKQAFQNLSPAEKTALGAGLLGLLLLGPLTMYSRIKRDDALENDTRREIYEIVEANPGVCIKDAADEADVSYSTASYHLDRLVRMDYIARREEGNKVLYYKNGGTFTKDEQELVPVLKNAEAMRVFEHILENPWCYRAEVAEALDVSHTTVNWHLKRLEQADLVEEHREGRSCHLNIPQEALDRVVEVLDKLEAMGVEDTCADVPQPAVAA